jgi:hypothetical protein
MFCSGLKRGFFVRGQKCRDCRRGCLGCGHRRLSRRGLNLIEREKDGLPNLRPKLWTWRSSKEDWCRSVIKRSSSCDVIMSNKCRDVTERSNIKRYYLRRYYLLLTNAKLNKFDKYLITCVHCYRSLIES